MAADNEGLDRHTIFRLSTNDLPSKDRVSIWREFYGRQVLRLEIEALGERPFSSDLVVHSLPGVEIVKGRNSPFRIGRTKELLSDADDGLILQWTDIAGRAVQLGRDVDVCANDAILLSNADVGDFTFPATCTVRALRLRRAALAPLVGDLDDALVRPVPGQDEALRLLAAYIAILERKPPASALLAQLVSVHIYDLAAIALGATGERAEHARGRGVRAARLHSIEAQIAGDLHRAELSVTEVAARQGISPRSVQALFEATGTTFSRFVLEQRLLRAHRLLVSPLITAQSITAIAYDCGFNDLSYFNRTFRRRFGMTPSEARAAR